MSETKFTPGPWKWKGEDYRGGWGWQLLVGPNGEGLICGEDSDGPYQHLKAFVPIDPKYCETAPRVHVLEANAHLIAAAPELYEALENLTRLANFPKEASYKEVFESWGKARAALAKARGESHE